MPKGQSLLIVWLLGIGLCLSKKLYEFFQLLKLPTSELIQDKTPIPSGFQCVTAKQVEVPFLMVTLKNNWIFLPEHANQWSEEKLKLVISHEVCHHIRKDHWSIWISLLAKVLFWFHPLIYWVINRQKECIELACDQKVIALGDDKHQYAKTLVAIAGSVQHSTFSPSMAVKQKFLSNRISQLLNGKQEHLGRYKSILLCLLLLMAASASVFAANFTRFNAADFIDRIESDLPDLSQNDLPQNHVVMAAFYDGADQSQTFLSLEMAHTGGVSSWVEFGPLKKFNEQIHTWHLILQPHTSLTGHIKINGITDDGFVDGLAIGMISNKNGASFSSKSKNTELKESSAMLCAWPLDFTDKQYLSYAENLGVEGIDKIKRLLCGSYLLKNGHYQLF